MLVLGIETSTQRSSVALANEHGLVAAAGLGVPRRHGEFVAPAIRFCLQQADIGLDKVSGIAVGLGPGLYTGLRVGIATAQSLAAALQLPVVGMSGLDVLAFRERYVRRLICACIDARRGELFWAFYRTTPGGVQRVGDIELGRADRLAADIHERGEECLVVGDGGLVAADHLRQVRAEVAGPDNASPEAVELAELAVPRFIREETQRAIELQPIYLRQADARIGWQERGRLWGGEAAS